MWPLMWPHLFCSVLFCYELFVMVFLTLLLDSPSHNPDLEPEPVLLCCVTINLCFSRHHPACFCHYQPSKSFSHVDAVAYWPILSERNLTLYDHLRTRRFWPNASYAVVQSLVQSREVCRCFQCSSGWIHTTNL
jgi:hypothetical protein